MGVLRVLEFKIRSSIHDYFVEFTEKSSEKLKKLLKHGDVVIIDKKVVSLNQNMFKSIPSFVKIIEIDAKEEQKSYLGLIPIINGLINDGFKKNHKLVAIGGGITQDVTAFISSIIYRGVNWYFFPTTLLAQGDSCIGSKTSINFGEYKNQLGGFYPPNKVYIDLKFLDTLSESDLQSGFGEMCHYFIVSGEKDFKEYVMNYQKFKQNKNILNKMIHKSLLIKKSYIEIDEFDQNKRQIFNYGHTFGHAIESLTGYQIPHGIAVSFGMDIANYISVKKSILEAEIRLEIRSFLKKIWYGFNIKNLEVEKFIIALSKDKKNVGEELRLILCEGYGKVFKKSQSLDSEFKKWLNDYFKYEAH